MTNNPMEQRKEPGMDGPRAVRPEEHPAVLRFISSIFRPENPQAMENEYPLVLGRNNIENMRVIVEGSEIISHTAIYYSTLRVGDLAFKVGGISAVATHPDYRGKGLAGRVMRDCIKVMRERGCHLSFLWTDRHDFYRNLGYEPAGSFYLFKPDLSSLPGTPPDCEIVHYSPDRLPEIIEIHEREPVRTERTSKEYETYFALPGLQTLLALRNGSVSAYAVMGKGRDLRDFMHDWGGEPGDLLRLARELVDRSETGEIFVLAPAHDNKFTSLLTDMAAPGIHMKFVMLSVIDVEGLSSLVSDSVSSRLGRDFRIVQDSAGVKIKVGGEEAHVEPARMLASILFGPDTPSGFLGGLSQDARSALDEALPIPLFIWGLDWV